LQDKLVGENKQCRFFTNSFCGEYKGYNIVIAESKKSKERNYIAIKNNKIEAEDKTLDGIGCAIDILRLAGY